MKTATISAGSWRRIIKQANAGDPRHLLEALLVPTEEDGQGNPLAFTALPDDATLRYDLVRVLMLGPWKSATTIAELMTRTGWGRTKPALSAFQVAAAAAADQLGIDVDHLAGALAIDGDTLRKKIKARKGTK